jgi:nucleotide-binding universal stress UspA family protein
LRSAVLAFTAKAAGEYNCFNDFRGETMAAGLQPIDIEKEDAMPNIKHIAFPVDFSDRCNSAVAFVEGMARRHGARVTLISVAHPHYAGGIAGAPVIDPQEVLSGVKTRLDNTFINEFQGLEVNRVAEIGDPATAITDFVNVQKVDLVMMPTHGYGPFRQLLLGSVTAKVLHDVTCPVWTTAHTGEAPDREHLDMRKIVCAVDATSASIALMRWAGWLSKDLGATLRLVHAVPGIEAWPERQMDQEFEEQIRENARKNIEELEKAADIDVPVCVGAGTVPDVVREEALQHGADLIVIGRGALQEKLGRLRTHSYGIIRHAPCPVISV